MLNRPEKIYYKSCKKVLKKRFGFDKRKTRSMAKKFLKMARDFRSFKNPTQDELIEAFRNA